MGLCASESVLVDRDELRKVVLPPSTKSYVPVPHHRLFTEVVETLEKTGFEIRSEQHGLWRNGQRYFATVDLKQDGGDYGLVVGVRNSHDKSFPAAIALGASVFVCDNLSFSGEVSLERRHTRFILRDLPSIVATAVDRLTDVRQKQGQRIDRYKSVELTPGGANDLVIQLLDARAITTTQIPAILSEYREPRHPEFRDRNVWSLHNAVTEISRVRMDVNVGSQMATLSSRTQAMSGVLDAFCGLAV